MHTTLEGVQQSATPAIRGPLQVYVVVFALGLTLAAPTRLGQAVAGLCFLGLTIDAVGVGPLRWLGVPVFFLAPGLAVVLVTAPGAVLYELGPLTVTDTGLQTALDTTVRSLATLSILAYLIASTPVSTVVLTLRKAGLPDVLVELFLYVYRAIATVMAEAERMHTAATARAGFGNRRATLRTMKLLASALFVRTIDRVEALDESLRARCYDGEPPAQAHLESEGYGYALGVLVLLVGVHLL
ncbi:cobalt ECF transporter T component CbiQ [Halodesulfurarchaeum formicicum]|uniref:Cobalt ECF transporter T component CbiQ n=1 Tax=Halodesulfurarchaeum formicicum TaxID=1873524 RepID=A0A1D8S6M1_9EURY|nr:energy-coupling factor transporter transmembrane component T [Halodesulfurarchaeum formicicum]AOW81003.1 cobalt ECF transporter T component CbiQ [Halodesulfurarchaeum formicicum]